MVCLCLGRRGLDDGYTYGMQPSSARASVASSEGYGPNRASRSTHEDAFGGGDPLGEPPHHSAIRSSTSLPFYVSSLALAISAKSLCICLLVHLLPPCVLVRFSQSVSQSANFSQPCSASCVCLYYERQPMPSACAKTSMKEAPHDLPDAQETCCASGKNSK